MQMLGVITGHVLDLAAVEQVAVEELDALGDGDIFGRHHVGGTLLEGGVDVDLDVAREQFAEGGQQATVLVLIVFFRDEIEEFPHAENDADVRHLELGQVVDQRAVVGVTGDNDRLPDGVEQDGTVEEIALVEVAVGAEVFHGQFGEELGFGGVHVGRVAKLVVAAAQHILVDQGGGAEAAAHDHDRAAVEKFAGVNAASVLAEHGHFAEAVLDQPERKQAVVHLEIGSVQMDHVDGYPTLQTIV